MSQPDYHSILKQVGARETVVPFLLFYCRERPTCDPLFVRVVHSL